MALSNVAYCQTGDASQIELHSFKDVKSAGGMDNLAVKFIDNWPMDVNGEYYCAWIRVRFENMTKAEARSVTFNFGNSAPLVEKRDRMDESEKEIWLFVTPTDNAIMEADVPMYGMSNRLPNIKLEEKHAYDVVLKNNKTVTVIVYSRPDGAIITLDSLMDKSASSPATFFRVPLGSHKLTISYDGNVKAIEEIEVSERNVNFMFDYRPEKEVLFTSDPSGADLYLNGAKKGVTPISLTLRYDQYKVTASRGEAGTDSKVFDVNEDSEKEIRLYPINTPIINTMNPDIKSSTSAVLFGKIINAGNPAYKERGFVYSTKPDPELKNSAKVVVAGSDTGSFNVLLSFLAKGATYYLKAYAKTSKDVYYGEAKKITMSEYYDLPTFEYEGHIYRIHPAWQGTDPFGSWSIAKEACDNLYSFGYNDWIMPTKEQFMIMYDQKYRIGWNQAITCFFVDGGTSANTAWQFNAYYNRWDKVGKNAAWSGNVRPIRLEK